MKKALLTNPAFRYIFEIIVIVFSVTLSFYIQDVLNDREKIELKNESLQGVLASNVFIQLNISFGDRSDIGIGHGRYLLPFQSLKAI